MELLKNTFFINLEERKDRLEHVKIELSKLNIKGERINAVKTISGAIGCSLSHIKCLELAKEREYEQIFICEDDITFLNPKLLLENLGKFIGEAEATNINGWDVIIIGGNNAPPSVKIGDFCRRVYNCQTTTGYIVKKHYYDVLIKNMKDGVHKLLKNPENKREYALDIHWKLLQKYDNWFFIVPPTVIQYNNYSDIEKTNTDYKHLMLDLDKEWLFSQTLATPSSTPEFSTSDTPPQPQVVIPNPIFHNMTYYCKRSED